MLHALAPRISLILIALSAVMLIALQLKPAGWLLLALSAASLFLTDRKFAQDLFLIIISLGILGLTPIDTTIDTHHMLLMGATLGLAVGIPYLVSRFIYGDYLVRFKFRHGRYWYKSEVFYIAIAAFIAYLVLPFYLTSTGAYLNWPSAVDGDSLIRLFIGTNALGIWDELFFVSTVLGIARRHFSFLVANLFQAVLFTSFLFELGFTGWGFVMIFLFALLQGYIFKRTESLFYVISIHLTVDLILFLALVHAHHPAIFAIFVT